MATLNINGRRVKVDDSFRDLSPEQQQATVDEIARSAGMVASEPGSDTIKLSGRVTQKADEPGYSDNIEIRRPAEGLAMNATAGLNRALLEGTGGFVDRARNVINWGVAGVNALRGSDDLTEGMIRNAVGDSNSIAGAMEAVGVRDPRTVQPTNMAERIAAGVGEGVGATFLPQAGLAAANHLGMVGQRAGNVLSDLVGPSNSLAAFSGNAVAGAGAGAGVAVADELAPGNSLAALGGGLAGAGAGTLLSAVPRVVGAGARIAGDFVRPFTGGGREQMAGQQLWDAASSPGAAVEALGQPGEVVPGSRPTTFQQSGDMGLGQLERGYAARFPDEFGQRGADQNAARVSTIEGMQGDGAPERVVAALKDRLRSIDEQMARAEADAGGSARGAAADLGSGRSPEIVGAEMRSSLEAARAAAKVQERALWQAVDPDGTLALRATNAKRQMDELMRELPASARQPEGEEQGIYDALSRYRDVVPFSELTALQSRIKTEMRAEKMAKGETPAWRRLSLLNGALERDIDAAVAGKVSDDAAAVAAGRMAPDQSMAARIEAASAPQSGTSVYTPSGRKVDVAYRVIEADEAVTSNTDDLRPNPTYASDLQPRNRTRTASEVQIARMAGELQPERLGPSASAAEGAPIIGPDGMVESGNARMLAIRKAYQQGGKSAQAYRQYLQQQGYDLSGIRNPVLVRVRQTPLEGVDRVRFTQEANASPALAMSASERAASDASRLDGSILDLYRGGDVGSADNRDFVRAFLGKVADQGEEGAFVTKDGTLSLDGARRVQSALLRAAYDDTALMEALADAGDENVRVFGRALADLSGDVAKLKSQINSGQVDPGADISPALVEAAKFVQEARRRGVSLPNALAQQDAFDAVSSDAIDVLRAGYGADLTARFSRDRFDSALGAVIDEAQMQTTDARLFGEAMGVSDILQGVSARYGGSTGTAQGFARASGNNGARLREGGSAARRAVDGPGRPEDAAGVPRGAGRAEILERPAEPELAPNFDAAAQSRLRAARDATRARAETFDNKTLGPMRRRPSTTAPYDMPDAQVAARVFNATAASPAAMRTFRNAVGDDVALPLIRDVAIDRLRRAALREDGTFDPGRVNSWRRSHADALRSLPELDAQLANAAKASETLAASVAARREAVAEAQTGALGRLIGMEDPADVVRAIGSIFGRQDAATQMKRLAQAIGRDPEAREGLRRAVVDHVMSRFISNTEAGTSGIGRVKSDQFQTFVARNKQALRESGFNGSEINTMERLATDLQRANRSIAAVRIPGGSNTAQDLLAAKPGDTGAMLLAKALVSGGGTGAGVTAVAGPLAGAGAGLAAAILVPLRQVGISKVDDLIKDALLNPERARILMTKVPADNPGPVVTTMGQRYRRAVLAGLATAGEDRKPEMPPRIVVEGARPVAPGQEPGTRSTLNSLAAFGTSPPAAAPNALSQLETGFSRPRAASPNDYVGAM